MSGTDAAAFVAAGASLAMERTLVDVLALLREARAEPIAIKGPLQARWLYGMPRRPPLDLDLLVAPTDVTAAGEALRSLGYTPYLDRGDGASTDYAQTWHKDGSATIDLHWSLAGADAERLWPTLSAASEETMISGDPVQIPTVAGRALVLALHAAQHGHDEPHVIDDLSRALEIVDHTGWQDAAALARDAGAEEAFAAGLRLVPVGAELAERLRLTVSTTANVEIRAAGEPPTALAFERLSTTPRFADKGRILGRELVPPAAFMRDKYDVARRGRVGLALAYLYRPLWLAWWAPRGYLAWQRAKRSSRRSRNP